MSYNTYYFLDTASVTECKNAAGGNLIFKYGKSRSILAKTNGRYEITSSCEDKKTYDALERFVVKALKANPKYTKIKSAGKFSVSGKCSSQTDVNTKWSELQKNVNVAMNKFYLKKDMADKKQKDKKAKKEKAKKAKKEKKVKK